MEMTVPKPAAKRYTLEEYFKLAEASETKLEYRDGEIIDMAGALFAHNQIAWNLGRELGNGIKGGPCQGTGSDQRVLAADDRYAYPDIMIVCGDPVFDPRDKRQLTISNPTLLVEVLSPSTALNDRGEKLIRYINLPSLREYFLVSQDKPQVEAYTRLDDGRWVYEPVIRSMDATVTFRSVGAAVPMAEIYSGVKFSEPDADGRSSPI